MIRHDRPSRHTLRAHIVSGIALLAAVFVAPAVAADEFPTGPVKILVGFPAGGGTDIMARHVARNLEARWDVPVVVENRVGAGGIVAAEDLLRAEPDGQTLMMAHIQTVVLAPLSLPNADRAAIGNFTPISLVARQPHVVAVRAESPFQTVEALLAAARDGERLSYASTGIGGVQHLAAAAFAADAELDMRHIPYKGSAPGLQALIAGEIDVFFDGITPATPFLKSGDVRALAVTVAERIPSVDAPTLQETGFPGFDMTSWWALVGPPELADDRRAAIAEAVQAALEEPDFTAFLADLGVMSGAGFTGDRFDAFVETEVEKFAAIARALGIEPR